MSKNGEENGNGANGKSTERVVKISELGRRLRAICDQASLAKAWVCQVHTSGLT